MTKQRSKKSDPSVQIINRIFADRPDSNNTEFYDIPLLGEVHMAGRKDSRRHFNITDAVKNFLKSDQQTITVQAVDNGMANAGIYHGDLLTINSKMTLHSHDIAAVRIGERLYIRRIFFEKEFVRLETDEPGGSPYIIDPSLTGFEIVGKVVTVVREL